MATVVLPSPGCVLVIKIIFLGLLSALMLWVFFGWMIDFYLAETAAERFQAAMLQRNLAAACMNAGIWNLYILVWWGRRFRLPVRDFSPAIWSL